jgi:hypothetical protein
MDHHLSGPSLFPITLLEDAWGSTPLCSSASQLASTPDYLAVHGRPVGDSESSGTILTQPRISHAQRRFKSLIESKFSVAKDPAARISDQEASWPTDVWGRRILVQTADGAPLTPIAYRAIVIVARSSSTRPFAG